MNQYDVMITKLRHYDTTYEYDMSMYDNLPYKRDRERANEEAVNAVSGNVYSVYSYNFIYNPTPYVLKQPDMDFSNSDEAYVADNNYIPQLDYEIEDDNPNLTASQLDSLLSDNEFSDMSEYDESVSLEDYSDMSAINDLSAYNE